MIVSSEWYGEISRSSILEEYKNFKDTFIYEKYLDLVPFDLRFFITRLRISAHTLRIHTGRFGENRLPRHERICLNCNLNDIEDIYHFVCICPHYRTLRIKYIKRNIYTRPSVFKFYNLLKSIDSKELYHLALYLKEAFTLRGNINFIRS